MCFWMLVLIKETINLFANHFKINEIYSFEPSPISYKILTQNIIKIKRKFNKTKFFLENIALGSRHEKIYIKHISGSSSSTIRELNTNSKYFKKKFFFLKKLKIKTYIKKFKFSKFYFLII